MIADGKYDRPMVDGPKPQREEQQPASEVVTEIAPGVLRAQLPINMPGLGHVNMYVLEDERGVAVVDPGLPGKRSWSAINDRLRDASIPLSRVHTVIVTHSHPDHFGGAARLRAETGAEIVTHRRFRVLWDPSEPADHDVEDAADLASPDRPEDAPRHRKPWDPTPWVGQGISLSWRRRLGITVARAFPQMMRLPTPTVRLDDAATIRLAGREWVAVHTPGHTEDHLCLYDPEGALMLCGDHVLPTITPHISGLIGVADPLQQFFASLDKVAAFGPQVRLALPAHGHPFEDLAGRALAIKEHHDSRLQRLRDAATEIGRPATVMEMSTHLFSPRAQGAMADSETFAHLEHLRLAGDMERHDSDGAYHYVLTG